MPKLWPIRKRSRNGERPEAQTGGPGKFPGLPGGAGVDRTENDPTWDKEPGSLSAEDGPGRLCGATGPTRAERACISVAPEQQQSEPAHPPGT